MHVAASHHSAPQMVTLRSLARHWYDILDPLAEHPRSGTVGGLLLVIALVPILNVWHGASGPLGQSIPLFFLVPVLLASAVGGRVAGVIVSFAALAVWDWFFIQPLYTVTIASVRDVLALGIFLVVAFLVGQISRVARRRTEEALRRAHSSQALYELTLALNGRQKLEEVLPALTQRLLETFNLGACAVLLPNEQGDGWHTVAAVGRLPADLRVEENRSLTVTLARVQESGEECVLGYVRRGPSHSERMVRPQPGQERARFLPLQVGARPIGVLELVPRANHALDPELERLLATFANGAAIALEQARLTQEEQAAALARESDRLKSALLSSVSHDLRTPLAGIKAAASSLLQNDVAWSDADRRAFLTDIDLEADRLARLVSNLLDLSRIEAGAIKPNKEWEDAGELIERVLRQMASRLSEHPIERQLQADLPAIRLDAVQIEQVLTNLLENAAKYSPSGTPIRVEAQVLDQHAAPAMLRIAVSDQGAGIPAGEQERIFDKFYRVAGGTRGVSGTGMGLAIVKGLVEAHGGQVQVDSTPGHGSTFSILLPLKQAGQQLPRRDQETPALEGLPR